MCWWRTASRTVSGASGAKLSTEALRNAIAQPIAEIGQFCIDTRLAYALKGDIKKGLFFRGSETVPFGAAIRPVADLMRYFLTGAMPAL